MNRALRILAVTIAVLVIAVTSFLMGFGASFVVTSTSAHQAAAAPAAVSNPSAALPYGTPTASTAPLSSTPTASRVTVADVQAKFNLFWEALRKVTDNYYDQTALDTTKIVYGAIKGAVDSLGDPHTYFSAPEQLQRSQEDLQGAFEGIGATIEKKDNKLLIVAPIAGTPAQKAGLKPADWITKIDGQDTASLSVSDGVGLIRGKKGTIVVLTIVREGVKDPFDVAIVRDTINVPNVKLTMVTGDIAHIQLVNVFTANLGDELKQTLLQAQAQGAKKVILDVRGNPGGYLNTAVQVASQFLKDGAVAYELTRDGKTTEIPVMSGGVATDWPIVVLIDKGSASASEIVAGAIQDSGRGPLIGVTSYGKGSVQQDFTLSDGSAVHVTVANWLTPKMRNINNAGLKPDIEVPLTDEDTKAGRDPQLDRAIQYLQTGN
jgi:carboxyl-terminal processing protease